MIPQIAACNDLLFLCDFFLRGNMVGCGKENGKAVQTCGETKRFI